MIDTPGPPTALPKRRHPRLAPEEYARPDSVCSVTLCVAGRRTVFSRTELAKTAVEVLRSEPAATSVAVYGFCLMPDHFHLVLSPSETCDIPSFVGRYKNLVQRVLWVKGLEGKVWQTSYWDHFLRAEEDLDEVVRYVLDNPVRKGLFRNWRDYPFSGSLVLDLG